MKPPKVSILIPVYNTELYIGATIESVISQTFDDWELNIVDDCSTDHTYKICQEYAQEDARIRLYKNDMNLGMMANWNHGIDLCHPSALYWGKLDADDIWLPDVLDKCVAILEKEREVGLVCGAYECMDEHGAILKNSFYNAPIFARNKGFSFTELVLQGTHEMFKYGLAQQGIGLLRKKIFSELGKFSLHDAGDTEMWFRIGCHYKVYTCSALFHRHRIWDQNFTRRKVLNTGKSKKNMYEVRQKILDYYYANQVLNHSQYRKYSKDNSFEYDKYLLYQYRANAKLLNFFKLFFHSVMAYPGKLLAFYTGRLFTRLK